MKDTRRFVANPFVEDIEVAEEWDGYNIISTGPNNTDLMVINARA